MLPEQTTPAPDPATAAPAGDVAAAPAPARPEWLPEAHWDGEKGSIKLDDFGKHYAEVAKVYGEHQARVAALPKDPAGYKLELPAEFKAPEGAQIKFDESDPRVAPLRELALKYELPQQAVSELLAIDAQNVIADAVAEQARVAEEMKKLGDKASERLSALQTALKPLLSATEYAALRGMATDAAAIVAIEKLVQSAKGPTIPATVTTDPPKPPPVDPAKRMFPNMK